MKIGVRVRPGSRRTSVGGRYGDGDPPVLVVRVAAPAIEGRANEEARRALAKAFDVPTSGVSIVSGAKSRTKVFEVHGAHDDRLAELLEAEEKR